jgi:hypothetical protein
MNINSTDLLGHDVDQPLLHDLVLLQCKAVLQKVNNTKGPTAKDPAGIPFPPRARATGALAPPPPPQAPCTNHGPEPSGYPLADLRSDTRRPWGPGGPACIALGRLLPPKGCPFGPRCVAIYFRRALPPGP